MENYYFYAKNMCVGYNNKPLIKEIEIMLPKGEILTLIGPNGAGKSTVLKSIAGQLILLGGTIYLGKEILSKAKLDKLAKKMSVVFTERIKTEMMTCRDVVATGRYPYTGLFGILSKEDKKIVNEVMELVHIIELSEQDFNKISDGQKQRVMLARAICQEPELIILDEPTSYLDIKYKLEFLSILQEMRRKKRLTVIMSLHELELAQRISDKILCLKGEYVEAYGTVEEVFQQGYIEQLFEITEGSFDERSGNLELKRIEGNADIFVIAGYGSGRKVYHTLQRKGKSFLTGILYDNDLDYPVAKALAEQVIEAKALEPVEESKIEQAKKGIDLCSYVLCPKKEIGSLDRANQELIAYAEQTGKLINVLAAGQEICTKIPQDKQDYDNGSLKN